MRRFALPVSMVLLAACLESAAVDYLQCESTADCNAETGQVCDDGICWGDPPDQTSFAAILVPPADRVDLAVTELGLLTIAPDGTIADLEFAETILVHGRVSLACTEVSCANLPVAAQVTVSRASSISGGPRYTRSILTGTESRENGDTFSFRLPKDSADYQVTISIDDSGLDKSGGATLPQAPPMSLTLRADRDHSVEWVLGQPDKLKAIHGCIVNAVGNGAPYAGMHVSAFGQWTPLSKPTRASALVIADLDGCFELTVPIDMLDDFEILAQPGPSMVLPTLRLRNEFVPDPLPDAPPTRHEIVPALPMPNAPNPIAFKLPLRGRGSGGLLEPVPGAQVVLSTSFAVPESETRNIEVGFSTSAVSSGLGEPEPGTATVEIFPGTLEQNRDYTARIVPAPDSESASVFATTVTVGTGEGASVLESIVLERRVAVTGSFESFVGEPIANAPLEVRPSPLIRWALEATGKQSLIDNLQLQSEVTGEDGAFVLWLDFELAGLMALYDLELSPPATVQAPRWTFQTIELAVSGGPEAVDLGVLELPRPSYARGKVRDANGALVPGAEVRVYQIPSTELCQRLTNPDDCAPPALLRGSSETDASGRFTAVLPDP